MATTPKSILDLSAAGLKKLEKRDGIGIKHLILDNNELSKLENMECFPDLEKLSGSGNSLIRMFAVGKCPYLTHINLSNNSIACIEGIKDLHKLTFLNLSVNKIKVIQNFVHSETLTHVDLSKNDIARLDPMSCLVKLKNLHLSGNKISSLEKAVQYLPASLCVLSLADNSIEDLNEVSYLVGLENLEQLNISGNPCVTNNEKMGLPTFDYRPFIINWCLGLRLLDGYVATQKESLKAEWLYSQGKGRHFKPGEHRELVEYLAQVCPLNSDKLVEEEDEKLSRILHMQRQHKEQFLSEMSQSVNAEPTNPMRRKMSRMTQSYHASDSGTSHSLVSQHSSGEPSRIMYESAPDVLFNCSELAQSIPSTSDTSSHLLSKSEMLHNSARSPITIEQVAMDSEKVKQSCIAKPPQIEERRLRPASTEMAAPPAKGPLVRKVSRRSTSPNVSSSNTSRPKVPTSYRSKISPSRSCILGAKFSISKNSSESDTSEESSKNLHQNIRRTVKPYSPQSSSPAFRQKLNSEPIPSKESSGLEKGVSAYSSSDEACLRKCIPISVIFSKKYGVSEEKLCKAVTRIQSVWRGYYVRNCNPRIHRMRLEIRFRRSEDHVQHLHGHMCRLTDFVLRQQKDLQYEREMRKIQAEKIRVLEEKTKELEKDLSFIIMKAKQNELQKVPEHCSYDIQNLAFSRKFISKDKHLPGVDHGRLLQDISPDSPSSYIQYSTQTFQENSGLFSPSSQTSSVTSVGLDGTFSQTLSHPCLQPSASDLSDADSGLHSMVSPNISAFIEAERNLCSDNGALSESCNTSLLSSFRAQHKKQLPRSTSDNQDRPFPEFSGQSVRQPVVDLNSMLLENKSASILADKSLSEIRAETATNSNDTSIMAGVYQVPNAHSCKIFDKKINDKRTPDNSFSELMYDENDSKPEKDSAPGVRDGLIQVKKQDASLSPIFPFPPQETLIEQDLSLHMPDAKINVDGTNTNVTSNDTMKSGKMNSDKISDSPHCCNQDNVSSGSLLGASKRVSDSTLSPHSVKENACGSDETLKNLNITKGRPTVFSKAFGQGLSSNSSTPLDDCNSPQSPCTVEMSGRISHSCSFQSDGFTAAEELSATTTVKLFSARTMTMTCGSNPQSPQTAIQRPLSLSEPVSQGSIHSPLVLATHLWEKKVQDIQSTFQHLQAQIREFEGAFGQVGHLNQILYPSILPDESKDSRHLIHCIDPNSGSLVLDMPKVNFKRGSSTNADLFLPSHFSQHGANGVPYLPPSNYLPQASAQSNDYCRIEELDDAQNLSSSRAKSLKLPLCSKMSNDPSNK